jgi:hypothetical protein
MRAFHSFMRAVVVFMKLIAGIITLFVGVYVILAPIEHYFGVVACWFAGIGLFIFLMIWAVIHTAPGDH